ncbi:MAG: hypothetical protein OCD01_05855 [Fibrobacterales bacterium]
MKSIFLICLALLLVHCSSNDDSDRACQYTSDDLTLCVELSRALGNEGCISAIENMGTEDSLNIFSNGEVHSVTRCAPSNSTCMIKEGSTWGNIVFYEDSTLYYKDEICGKGYNLDSLHLILDSLVQKVESFTVYDSCKLDSTLDICTNLNGQSVVGDTLTIFTEDSLKVDVLNMKNVTYDGNVKLKTENSTTFVFTIKDSLFVQTSDSLIEVQYKDSGPDTLYKDIIQYTDSVPDTLHRDITYRFLYQK